MQIGIIGLGRMGGNIARRLMSNGHEVVAFDRNTEAASAVAKDGARQAESLPDLVEKLKIPRILWIMLPAGEPTEATIVALSEQIASGDTIIDGGNTFFKDDIRRARTLRTKGIHYVDVGTSGGIWGPERGYIHAGASGAGHFVKMVHNGIEYGLMQAYAEGFDILRGRAHESLPAEERFDLDLTDIAEVWRRGSVISSWLLDLTAIALAQSPDLDAFGGYVQDSGEGRWTVNAAVEEAVPATVITASLYARFASRVEHDFANRLLSAMRNQFGGHVESPIVKGTAEGKAAGPR